MTLSIVTAHHARLFQGPGFHPDVAESFLRPVRSALPALPLRLLHHAVHPANHVAGSAIVHVALLKSESDFASGYGIRSQTGSVPQGSRFPHWSDTNVLAPDAYDRRPHNGSGAFAPVPARYGGVAQSVLPAPAAFFRFPRNVSFAPLQLHYDVTATTVFVFLPDPPSARGTW